MGQGVLWDSCDPDHHSNGSDGTSRYVLVIKGTFLGVGSLFGALFLVAVSVVHPVFVDDLLPAPPRPALPHLVGYFQLPSFWALFLRAF